MDILGSARFWELFQGSGLTGLTEVGPATIVKLKKHKRFSQELPRYYCLRVSLSRASIDDEQSGIEREDASDCPECHGGGLLRARRVMLEESSWSGEDMFIARGFPGTVLVTERFKRFCEANAISNCRFVPAEDYSFDLEPLEAQGGEH